MKSRKKYKKSKINDDKTGSTIKFFFLNNTRGFVLVYVYFVYILTHISIFI